MKQYLPYILPLVVIAIFWLRYRDGREVKVSARRIAASGAIIFTLIAFTFVMEPRHEVAASHWLIIVVSAAAGSLIGIARAKSFQLRRVGDIVVMKTSSMAIFLLSLLILVRGVIRQNFAEHSVIALDSSLIFILIMALSQRLVILSRLQSLRGAMMADRQV